MFTKLSYIYGMKYLNGKIYKLIDNTNGNIYIGSTCKSLKERLKCHKGNYSKYNKKDGKGKGTSSYHIIKNNDYNIELLENFPCNSKQELLNKERQYIENNECINIYKPITSYEDKYNKHKQWLTNNKDKVKIHNQNTYKKHKDKIAEKQKIYHEANKDKILEKQKIYNEANKDKLAEKRKEWYDKNKEKFLEKCKKYNEKNKDKIKERRSEKIQCDNCNSIITIYKLPRHKKTPKCQNYKKD